MKQLLIVQFRDDESVRHEKQCYHRVCKLPDKYIRFVNATTQDIDKVPDLLEDVFAVVVGGSGQFSMVRKHKMLTSALAGCDNTLEEIIDTDFPFLGVCFGHQLLGEKLGGIVETDQEKGFDGTEAIALSEEGQGDGLYAGHPREFVVQMGHADSITKLSGTCTVLATSESGAIASFKCKENLYGIQFHSELDVEANVARSMMYRAYSGDEPENEIRKKFWDDPSGEQVLDNFIQMYRE